MSALRVHVKKNSLRLYMFFSICVHNFHFIYLKNIYLYTLFNESIKYILTNVCLKTLVKKVLFSVVF